MTAQRATSALTGRPAKRTLLFWVAVVLAVHLALLLGLGDVLSWRLDKPSIRVASMQTRTLPAPTASPVRLSAPKPQTLSPTRIAQVAKPPAAPRPSPRQPTATQTPSPSASTTPDEETPAPIEASAQASAAAPSVQAMAPLEPGMPDASAPVSTANPSSEAAPPANSSASEAAPSESKPAPTVPAAALASSTMDLPGFPLGAVPSSTLFSYRLTGQEKGLQYTASGSLSWQHNESRYEMGLTVKAFLLGSRQWRSQGQISPTGLQPIRFSDSWRSERATHFDPAGQRIVFSSNAPTAVLQAGAQDQISLYAQLAAAMAADSARFVPGTRLQIQIATVRDALPWLLTLDKVETITVDGVDLSATKWVCQPRNRFDAQVEFWVTREHQWLPVRIRITQVNGNFIDLNLTGQAPLPPLPPLPAGNTPG